MSPNIAPVSKYLYELVISGVPDFNYAFLDNQEFFFESYNSVGVICLNRERIKNFEVGEVINPQITYLLREDGRSEGFHPISEKVFSSAYFYSSCS